MLFVRIRCPDNVMMRQADSLSILTLFYPNCCCKMHVTTLYLNWVLMMMMTMWLGKMMIVMFSQMMRYLKKILPHQPKKTTTFFYQASNNQHFHKQTVCIVLCYYWKWKVLTSSIAKKIAHSKQYRHQHPIILFHFFYRLSLFMSAVSWFYTTLFLSLLCCHCQYYTI